MRFLASWQLSHLGIHLLNRYWENLLFVVSILYKFRTTQEIYVQNHSYGLPRMFFSLFMQCGAGYRSFARQ